jgi:predicted dithiol-disulfide oxidoreductase (DUF899 family)
MKDEEIARLRRELGEGKGPNKHILQVEPSRDSNLHTSSRDEWLVSRKELLKDEKELSKQTAKLARQRRELPQYELSEDEMAAYVFEKTGNGTKIPLKGLFEQGSNELIIYHMMFGPDATKICSLCSFFIDQFAGGLPHLRARNVSFVVVGKGSWENTTKAVSAKQGWDALQIFSAKSSVFNEDFQVSWEAGTEERSYNYGRSWPYGTGRCTLNDAQCSLCFGEFDAFFLFLICVHQRCAWNICFQKGCQQDFSHVLNIFSGAGKPKHGTCTP